MSKDDVVSQVALHLSENAEKLTYGTVSAILTIHEGRISTVCYEIKTTIRRREEVKYEVGV